MSLALNKNIKLNPEADNSKMTGLKLRYAEIPLKTPKE